MLIHTHVPTARGDFDGPSVADSHLHGWEDAASWRAKARSVHSLVHHKVVGLPGPPMGKVPPRYWRRQLEIAEHPGGLVLISVPELLGWGPCDPHVQDDHLHGRPHPGVLMVWFGQGRPSEVGAAPDRKQVTKVILASLGCARMGKATCARVGAT